MGNHWYGAMLNSTFIIANPDMEYAEFINLGTLSWIFMILVSVTGIFSKQLVRKMKYRPWRWTHNIITLTALVLAITHGSVLLHARFF
jgi:predicted ferric reductase